MQLHRTHIVRISLTINLFSRCDCSPVALYVSGSKAEAYVTQSVIAQAFAGFHVAYGARLTMHDCWMKNFRDFCGLIERDAKLSADLIRYRVILKKVSFGSFRIILVSKGQKEYYSKQRQSAISILYLFGHCQNPQN